MATRPMNSLAESPQVFLDPAVFPKVHADQQPVEAQAAFAEFFPNGLPVVYKMCGHDARGVPRDYVEDNLPMGFYTDPPANARAIISTLKGAHSFRQMKHFLPSRIVHLWTRDEVQLTCNSLRQIFWEFTREMKRPYCWDDLWTYFDAFDLYNYGILNLWNVICQMYDENQILIADVTKDFAFHIGQWADAWLRNGENEAKLRGWDDTKGMIFALLTDQDRASVGNIQDDVVPLIASALKTRRSLLLTGNLGPGSAKKPKSLMYACETSSLENWLGKSDNSSELQVLTGI